MRTLIILLILTLGHSGFAQSRFAKTAEYNKDYPKANEYILLGSNLRSSPGVTDGVDNLAINSITSERARDLVFTGRKTKAPGAGVDSTDWYELRDKANGNKRVFIAQSRIGEDTKRILSKKYAVGPFRNKKNSKEEQKKWKCSSAKNLNLPENAHIKKAFSAPNFKNNQVFKSRGGQIQPESATDYSVKIKLDVNKGLYYYKPKAGSGYKSRPAVMCSNGKKQIVKYARYDDGWNYVTLGEAKEDKGSSVPVAKVEPKKVEPKKEKPASPPATGRQLDIVPRTVEIVNEDNSNLPYPDSVQ